MTVYCLQFSGHTLTAVMSLMRKPLFPKRCPSSSLSYALTPTFTMGGLRAAILREEKPQSLSFLQPFTWSMWISFLLLWLFYSLSLAFVSSLGSKMTEFPRQKEERFSLGQSVWYFSIVSIQFGADKHPKSISGKLLLFAWR